MKQIIIMMVVSLLALGCTATVKGPKVKAGVEVDGGSSKSKGNFCPPGQAKKGRC